MAPLNSTRLAAIVATLTLVGTLGCAARTQVVQRDDTSITNDVRERLAADPQTKGLDLTVGTAEGVVSVGGSVATDTQRNSIERIARETSGVRSVDNDVTFGAK